MINSDKISVCLFQQKLVASFPTDSLFRSGAIQFPHLPSLTMTLPFPFVSKFPGPSDPTHITNRCSQVPFMAFERDSICSVHDDCFPGFVIAIRGSNLDSQTLPNSVMITFIRICGIHGSQFSSISGQFVWGIAGLTHRIEMKIFRWKRLSLINKGKSLFR
jgi:hypothetical protein